MRTPAYLSPTAISKWQTDRDEFYLTYLAEERPPRIGQTQPMSIGSAFDARVKSHLHYNLFGNYGPGDQFEFDNIFEAQVEPHNRDWALPNSQHVFDSYVNSGALADLMIELSEAIQDPRFEFTVEARISHEAHVGEVVLLGKPDLHYVAKTGHHCLGDWKVNGYCSNYPLSPKPNYVNVRDGWSSKVGPATRTSNAPHKNAQVMRVGNVDLNIACYLEDIDTTWAQQLCIYGWVLGEPIGSDFIVGIEQIVNTGKKNNDLPLLRIATFRNRIAAEFQHRLFRTVSDIWRRIHAGPEHIFDDLSEEASAERCATLDNFHKAYQGDSPNDQWFQSVTREHRNY